MSSSSLAALLKKATIDDDNEILRASNAALKTSKNDLQAQRIKVVALLKLERYEDVVHFVEECGSQLRSEIPTAYAYALYKIGRWEEAAEIAAESEDGAGSQHLEAQARYRAEQFTQTASIYRTLAGSKRAGEDFDLRVNQSAVNAQLHWAGADDAEVKKPGREDLEAFETAFNAACVCVARSELAQAEVLLRRAKQLCQHSDDLTPEQKREELLPICVQQIYVLQRLGKESEAAALVPEIQTTQTPDLLTRRIARNNVLVTSSAPSNPFQLHKDFHSTPAIPAPDRPFSFQQRLLQGNEAAIDLKSFKSDGVVASAQRELQKHGSPSIDPNVNTVSALRAAALARNAVGSTALKQILPEIEKRPTDVGLILTVVQIYVSTGNLAAATQLMESFFKRLEDSKLEQDVDVRFNPGLVSVAVGLYRRQSRKAQVAQELAKASSYWRHRSKPPAVLLQAAGASLLESSNPQDSDSAKEIFSTLYKEHGEDKAVIAGYVASHAGDVSQRELEKLSSVATLIDGIEVDALEAAGIPQSANALAIAQGRTRKRPASQLASSKVKRVRKSRLPKDYDPNKKPDPERWLPLRDRSSYKPKGRRKGKKSGEDRTQGGVVADDATVNGVVAPKPQQAPGGGGGGGGGGGNKKKKGKGKR